VSPSHERSVSRPGRTLREPPTARPRERPRLHGPVSGPGCTAPVSRAGRTAPVSHAGRTPREPRRAHGLREPARAQPQRAAPARAPRAAPTGTCRIERLGGPTDTPRTPRPGRDSELHPVGDRLAMAEGGALGVEPGGEAPGTGLGDCGVDVVEDG
jgi:hypothetical protein